MLAERRGLQSVMSSKRSVPSSFLDIDMQSVKEADTRQPSMWDDESPQLKKLSLAPKRLREDDDYSIMDGEVPEVVDE